MTSGVLSTLDETLYEISISVITHPPALSVVGCLIARYSLLRLIVCVIVVQPVFEISVFFIVFNPVYSLDEDVQRIEFATFFIPYTVNLIVETTFLVRVLNRMKETR